MQFLFWSAIFYSSCFLWTCECYDFSLRDGFPHDIFRWSKENQIYIDSFDIKDLGWPFGRGVLANKTIQKGDIVLVVPATAMITPIVALESIKTMFPGSEKEEFLLSLSQTNLMCLFLLLEKTNSNSKWSTYIETLPNNFSTTIFWSKSELEELQSSTLKDFSLRKYTTIERQFHYLSPFFAEYFHHLNQSNVFTLDKFKWALSVLWSRTFSIRIDKKVTGGLVPLADMFNTNFKSVKIQHLMAENDSLLLIANDTILEGEQLFTSYGHELLGNGRLLLEYGFAIKDHPSDSMMILSPLIYDDNFSSEDSLHTAKLKILESLELSKKYLLLKMSEEIPTELLVLERIQSLNAEELGPLKRTIAFLQPISIRNERAAIRSSITHLRKILSSYATTMEQDVQILKEDRNSLNKNVVSAIVLRSAEKRMLKHFIHALERLRNTLFD